MIQFCANCGESLEENTGQCEEYPDCEALGMDEWRAKVHGDR